MTTYTYFKGDQAEYTGYSQVLLGTRFYEILLLEGHLKGETRIVKNPPPLNDESVADVGFQPNYSGDR